MLEEEELRLHAAQRRDEEQQTGNDERFLTSEIRGQITRKSGTDDTADKGWCRSETVPPVGVREVLGFHEESLQAFLGARNNCGVVTEKKTAQDGHHHNGNKVGSATRLILLHFLLILLGSFTLKYVLTTEIPNNYCYFDGKNRKF